MPTQLPDFVTHYSRGEPFRSVTGAPPEQWSGLVAGLTDAQVWGRARFQDMDYLPRRLVVERRMREALIASGGVPKVEQPFYAVMGSSPVWEKQTRAGMRAYRVRLDGVVSGEVSFTFGDSLLSWDEDYRRLVEAQGRGPHPRSGRLYRLEELQAMGEVEVQELEVQLWAVPRPDAVTVEEVPVWGEV